MPLNIFISKHKVIITITGIYLSASLVGSVVGLTIAVNDFARILVEIQEVTQVANENL